MWEYLNKLILSHPLIQSFITILAVSSSNIYLKIFPHKKTTYKNYQNEIKKELKKLLNTYENKITDSFYSLSKQYKDQSITVITNTLIPITVGTELWELNFAFKEINNQFKLNQKYFTKDLLDYYNKLETNHNLLISLQWLTVGNETSQFINLYDNTLKIIQVMQLQCNLEF